MRLLILFLVVVTITTTSCVRNNVVNRSEYQKIFDKYGVQGTFGTLDNAYNEFSIYNLSTFRDSACSPVSSFNLVLNLTAIELAKVTDNQVVAWNGVQYANETWNRTQTFSEAQKNNTQWYYQYLAKAIGKDTLQQYLDTLKYGSKKIIGTVDSCWLNNTLTIRADEQLGLVKKLYFNQLSNLYSNRTMAKVKNAMLVKKTDKYSLSYQSGIGAGKAGKTILWAIGWVEYGGAATPKVSFFVLQGFVMANASIFTTLEALVAKQQGLLTELLTAEKLLP